MVVQMQQNYLKNHYIFKEKNMYDFYKSFIFLRINLFFSKIKLFIQNKYMHPLSKNLILLKETSICKKTHSV